MKFVELFYPTLSATFYLSVDFRWVLSKTNLLVYCLNDIQTFVYFALIIFLTLAAKIIIQIKNDNSIFMGVETKCETYFECCCCFRVYHLNRNESNKSCFSAKRIERSQLLTNIVQKCSDSYLKIWEKGKLRRKMIYCQVENTRHDFFFNLKYKFKVTTNTIYKSNVFVYATYLKKVKFRQEKY